MEKQGIATDGHGCRRISNLVLIRVHPCPSVAQIMPRYNDLMRYCLCLLALAFLCAAAEGPGKTATIRGKLIVADGKPPILETSDHKLVKLDGDLQRRGQLAIMLGTGEHSSDDVVGASHLIETQLVDAIAAGTGGTVLATPPTGTAPGGLIDAVTHDADLDDAGVGR